MITRAQAEALLTLAEALEACEQLGWYVGSYMRQGSGLIELTPLSDSLEDTLSGMDVRLLVSEQTPKHIGS